MVNKVFLTILLMMSFSIVFSQEPIPHEIVCQKMFKRPIWVGPLPGTKDLIIVEQGGRIFKYNESSKIKTIFYDNSAKTSRKGNEEGLLGIAFHPKYITNKTFFIYYSAGGPRRSVITKIKYSGKEVGNSEKVIMEINQPWGNHNGGHIEFGPDGHLYIGLGDGGSGGDPKGHGQKKSTLLGSILRIDINAKGKAYGIPKDNPFVGQAGVKPEIFAYGLRNPWRFSFDKLTGLLYCGDVGQNKFEEVDIIVKGGNYGWNDMEGFHKFKKDNPTAIKPIAEYARSLGASITGGVVYRGKKTSKYYGWYFYGDFASKNLWALKYKDGKVVEKRNPYKTKWPIASFGFDHDGNVLICSFNQENIIRLKL